jgi:hypothetical protein
LRLGRNGQLKNILKDQGLSISANF